MFLIPVFLSVVLITAYLISRRRLRAGLASPSRIVQTALGPVEYVDAGAGPVIVHLHGMLGGVDHSRWCRFLVQAGFRVITPSRPGYLRTPLSSGQTPAEQAVLVAALLDALDVDRVAFYASSQGGAAALQFALAYPERCWGLVLFSAFTRPHPEMAKVLPYVRAVMSLDFLLWLLKPVLLPWVTAQAKKALPDVVRQDGEKMAGIREIFAAVFQAGLRGRGLTNDFTNLATWAGLPLEQVTTPVLLLHGSKDALVKPEDSALAAAEIPGAKLIMLDGAGHEALVTCVDQIEPTVLDFLDGCAPIIHPIYPNDRKS